MRRAVPWVLALAVVSLGLTAPTLLAPQQISTAGATTGNAIIYNGIRAAWGAPTPAAHDASLITSGTVNTARLGSGTATASTCLLGNSTWGACGSGGGSTPAGATGAVQYNSGGVLGGASRTTIDSNGDLNLAVDDAPNVPAAGSLNLFTRRFGNRTSLGFVDSFGEVRSAQDALGQSRVGVFNPLPNSTTLPAAFGMPAPTTVGTLTARTYNGVAAYQRFRRLGIVSAATAGALAEFRYATGFFDVGGGSTQADTGFTVTIRFTNSDATVVSGARGFVGVSTSTTAATNVEPSTLAGVIGIAQLSTDATQWYVVYGGNTAQTPVALGTAVGSPTTTNAVFELRIYSPDTPSQTVYVQLRNVATNVLSSLVTLTGTNAQLPDYTQPLTVKLWRSNNTTAAAVALDVGQIVLETRL